MTPAAPASPTALTLVAGAAAAQREALIATLLAPGGRNAVILEGLAVAGTALADIDDPTLQLIRIAPGCLCCTGNLVLRVTLNRLLRQPPAQLFISLADASHLAQLQAWLAAPPYDRLLTLAPTRLAG